MKDKTTLKETIDKLQEHIKEIELQLVTQGGIVVKLRNRLQLIKAQADEGFV